MWFLVYLLAGCGFACARLGLYVVAASLARKHGHVVATPEAGPAAYAVTLLVWPIDALVVSWQLAGVGRELLSQWLTVRRLRKAERA